MPCRALQLLEERAESLVPIAPELVVDQLNDRRPDPFRDHANFDFAAPSPIGVRDQSGPAWQPRESIHINA